MASREGSAAAVSDFASFRVIRGVGGLRRGLGAATLEVDSSVSPVSTSEAGGTGVAGGAGARRAREAAVCRRGREAAASGGTTVSFSGLVFLVISFPDVFLDAFFIVAIGMKRDHRKFLIHPISSVSFQTGTSEY
jgi:hypothetical protein